MKKLPCSYHLQLLTDHKFASLSELPDLVDRAILAGVNVVQLRDKTASKAELIDVGRELKKRCDASGIPLLVNDHLDVALTIEADGVHLGQGDVDYRKARRSLGKNKIIGLSVEHADQLTKLDCGDIDYLGVGPIYPTRTKPNAANPIGIDGLKQIRAKTSLPLIAIGGINPHNVSQLLNQGADGVAVVSAILGESSIENAAQALLKSMGQML